MSHHQVVLVRHGESEWNKKNLFCGWVDVDLSEEGVKQSLFGGTLLKNFGIKFDVAYTSLLKRAYQTLDILLKEISQLNCKVVKCWELTERHYGDLTGMDRFQAIKLYGIEKVRLWRWAYDVTPPPITSYNSYYKQIFDDPIFSYVKISRGLPCSESLKDVEQRVLSCWMNKISPQLKSGKRILIVAHGTPLRALLKYLNGISDEDIMGVQLPYAIPISYKLDESLKPLQPGKYLADDDTVKKAIETVAATGGST